MFSNNRHIDLQKLLQFHCPVQIFSIWLSEKYIAEALHKTMEAIDFYYGEISKNSNIIAHANSFADIKRNETNKLISGMLSIEGGEALMGDINHLGTFYDKGVRMLVLTWNNENELGYGTGCEDRPLKPFGKAVVKRMQELGMLVDVSHLSTRGFWDVISICKNPLIASHSNAYSLCPHKRNLNDEQIKAIVARNGLIGLNFYPPFLNDNRPADIYDIVNHAEYMMNIGGEDALCLGADFDGITETPLGAHNVLSLIRLFSIFQDYFGNECAEKIFYRNYERVLQEVL